MGGRDGLWERTGRRSCMPAPLVTTKDRQAPAGQPEQIRDRPCPPGVLTLLGAKVSSVHRHRDRSERQDRRAHQGYNRPAKAPDSDEKRWKPFALLRRHLPASRPGQRVPAFGATCTSTTCADPRFPLWTAVVPGSVPAWPPFGVV